MAAISGNVCRVLIASMAVAVTVACHAARFAPEQPAAAALVAQAAPEQLWSSAAYRVEWEEAHVPEEAAADVTIAVPVTVRNIGNRAWPAAQVFVAYHWFRDGRLTHWDGERTRLPRDLEPEGRAALSVRVATPAEQGSYILQLTLVHEQVTWFENKGADALNRPIVVRSTTRTVECATRGSTRCTAALNAASERIFWLFRHATAE